MAEKNKGDGHRTETPDVSHIRNVEVTHEASDVNVRAVLTFIVVLTVATIVICFGLVVLFKFFNQQEAKSEPKPGPMALKKEERLPPEPRLQAAPGFQVTLENGQSVSLEKAAPQTEYRVLRKQWEENLKTGLKDQSGNVVGMPIEAAMDKVVSEGLRSTVKEPNRKLSDFAIEMPTASSSGREKEKRLQ
ncbi:MAG TPA: hypothetical protein VLB46_14860 [Pyrinomonadaceae bacterium]|nr:hypothetical protein [Pyrinomonadaceae bacterium]